MTGLDFPDGCVFGNINLLAAHMFHTLTLSQSMSELKVAPSKGRTIAALLDAEFPRLKGDVGRVDKLISFRTMAYVQANIFLCAPKDTPMEELFERARTFQESLESSYKTNYPTGNRSIHPAYRQELQKVLSEYYEDVLSVKGASGTSKPRELKFRRSVDPAPAPAGSRDPTPPPGMGADPVPARADALPARADPLPARADPPPEPAPAAASPAKGGKGGGAVRSRGGKH